MNLSGQYPLVQAHSNFDTELSDSLQIPNVVEKSVAESPAMRKRPYTMRSFFLLNVRCTLMSPVPNMTLTPSVEGFFHHRYVPAVGIPGQHDASYAVYMPGTGDKEPR